MTNPKPVPTATDVAGKNLTAAWLQTAQGQVLPLGGRGVSWSLLPGLLPHVSEFVVRRDHAEEFLAAYGRGGHEDSIYGLTLHWCGRTFEQLRLLTPGQTDPWTVRLRVADRRADWQYVRLHMRANLVRRAHDRYRAAGLSSFGPSRNDDIRSFATYRYLSWSVQVDLDAPAGSVGPPWTAKALAVELLRRLLDRLGQSGLDEESVEAVPDNGVPLDAQEFVGATVTQAVGYCLARANLDLALDADGTLRLYDPFAEPDWPEPVRIRAGALRRPSLARIRPRKVIWYVPRIEEVRGTLRSTVVDGYSMEPYLENVAQISRPVSILDGGRLSSVSVTRYEAGTWVPIQVLLDYFGMSEEELRKLYMYPDALLNRYCKVGTGPALSGSYYDRTREALLNDLLTAYRTTYRFNPRWMERQLSISAYRVGVLDPTDRSPVPSPVYTQWYEIDVDLPVTAAVLGSPPRNMQRNVSSWDEDPLNPSPAPYSVDVVEPHLGIIRITPWAILDPKLMKRVPSAVTKPGAAVSYDLQGLRPTTAYALELAPTHRLEVVVTAEPGTPNDERAYHKIEVDTSEYGGLVSWQENHYAGEPARFDENGKLVNELLLRTILRAETAALMEPLRDRIRGVLTIEHDPESEQLKIQSNVREIRFTINPSGEAQVALDLGEPRQRVDSLASMPPSVAAYLQRQIVGRFREGYGGVGGLG